MLIFGQTDLGQLHNFGRERTSLEMSDLVELKGSIELKFHDLHMLVAKVIVLLHSSSKLVNVVL